MMQRHLIWSYGGGVQSVALAVLISQGALPAPERTLIADTGREAQSTWDYLHQHVAPLLSPAGVTVEVLSHDLAAVDLYRGSTLLIPAYSLKTGAPAPTYCSVEWKRRVVRRFLRSEGYGPDKPVDLWLGISCDEYLRAKRSDVAWCAHVYPLLKLFLRRTDCLNLIARAGLPAPHKSACWMCPWRTASERAELTPDEQHRAATFDQELRASEHVTIYRPQDDSADGCDSGGFCFT